LAHIFEKKCKNCDKKIIKPPYYSYKEWENKKFCSSKCFGLSIRLNPKTKYCLICKNKIIFNGSMKDYNKSKYCSIKCGGLGKRKKILKSTLFHQIRTSQKYLLWRKNIFIKRNKCEITNKNNIVAHHIKNFSTIIKENNVNTLKQAEACKELWDENNIIVLNKELHKLFHSIYGKTNNTMEQLVEFKTKICKKCKLNIRHSLYYCKECLISENERKKLVHRKQKEEGRCQYCGKINDTDKNLCSVCLPKANYSNSITKSNKASKLGHYGKMKQIMEII
jgi:hypothetical protein